MTIKSNSLIAYYYRWMFRGQLATDFCSLFWNTLFSIPLLVFTIPLFIASFVVGRDIWDKTLIEKVFRGVITYFVVFLGICFGLAVFDKVFGYIWKDWGFWQVIGAGLLGLIGIAVGFIVIFGIIIGICWIIFFINSWIKDKFIKVVLKEKGDGKFQYVRDYESKPIPIVIFWDTIRKKYCTKIKWK